LTAVHVADMTDASEQSKATIERLARAFAQTATAREELDSAEDNVRALLSEALAHGVTWSEIEAISGESDLTVQHRYRPSNAPGITATPTVDPLIAL